MRWLIKAIRPQVLTSIIALGILAWVVDDVEFRLVVGTGLVLIASKLIELDD